MRALVVYASRFGSTKTVAERITRGLRRRGIETDLRSVGPDVDVGSYDAVVFGSPVFDGRWMPAADAFVERNRAVLAQRRPWLFSTGSFGDTRRLVGILVRREPRGIRATRSALRARDYRVFAGVLDGKDWTPRGRMFLHAFGGRLGDRRDWAAIDAWTDAIALELRAAERS